MRVLRLFSRKIKKIDKINQFSDQETAINAIVIEYVYVEKKKKK